MRKQNHFFPSAGSLPKSTAAHTSVASKGNKKSPAPASRLALVFFLLTSSGVCAPRRCWLLHEHPAVPRAGSVLPCAGVGAHPGGRPAVGQLPMPGTPPSWDTPGSPGLGKEPEEEVPSAYPTQRYPWASINGIVNCLTDRTLASQKPGLPKTRAYLSIHHLHRIFSMLFSGGEKKSWLKNFLKVLICFLSYGRIHLFFLPIWLRAQKNILCFNFQNKLSVMLQSLCGDVLGFFRPKQ